MTGKFTFNPGFTAHQFNTADIQLNSSHKMSFNRFYPIFMPYGKLKITNTYL